MAKSGMNPKTLQYLMGHSDISVTLNVYTHVNFDDAKAEIARLKVMLEVCIFEKNSRYKMQYFIPYFIPFA